MLIHGNKVIIEKWQVEEILEKRVEKMHLKISDLFMVVPAPYDARRDTYLEGDTYVDTKYGKLKTFFCADAPTVYVLHHSKYPYPKISKVVSQSNLKVDLAN